MKEITRIHIAKVSYEIEVVAKKQLETYIDALTGYANDENVVEDIEIRITELLEARDVKAGGIITIKDVDAIQDTLGEPKDFLGEGDFAIGNDDNEASRSGKKFYRNIDDAVLGGVLSGLATYVGVNALWVRLLFVVLLFVSFGFAAFVYILLWIITPAAKSVTDKLLMKGEPVTLGSIRKYNEDQVGLRSTKELLARRRKVFGTTVGVFGVFSAIGAAVATAFGTSAWLVLGIDGSDYTDRWEVLGLLVASGVFLTLLSILISYAGFTKRVTKKIVILICSVIAAGILSFSSAIGLIGFDEWQRNDAVQKSITERSVTLPKDFSSVKRLVVDTENVTVTYQVSSEARAMFSAAPGPKVTVTQEGDVATVKVTGMDNKYMFAYSPILTIYGPAISDISVTKGFVDYAAKMQDLKAEVVGTASLTLSGNYTSLDAIAKESARVMADGASIRNVKLALEPSTNFSLGTVESLDVTVPVACPNGSEASITARGVSSSELTVNGQKTLVATQNNACWTVEIDSDEDYDGMPGM